MSATTHTSGKERALEDYVREHRHRLTRLCSKLAGESGPADDLAQETLVEAWRHLDRVQDVSTLPRWVAGVARNVCLRWRRAMSQQHRHCLAPLDEMAMNGDGPLDLTADATSDGLLRLERDELAATLDQALNHLSAATRAVVLARLQDDVPQAEVAQRLGMSEGAVALRLLRGRLALRRALTAGAAHEDTHTAGWRETSMWCTVCGQRRLEGRLDLARQELILRCPACDRGSAEPFCHHISHQRLFDGVSGFKPAYSRLLRWGSAYYRVALTTGQAACHHCGHPAPLRKGAPGLSDGDAMAATFFHIACARCGFPANNASLDFLLLALPESRRYWREHPRMRRLSPLTMETDGRPALLAGFESVTGGARLEAVVTRDTFDVLSVHIA